MSTDTVIGLDIGTTQSKALIRPLGDPRVLVVEQDTPWIRTPDLGSEITPSALLGTALELIARAVRDAESTWGSISVRGVSVTGLAESGVLLDPAGHADVPAIAWFDRRGQSELDTVAVRTPQLRAAFPAVTGLPWSFQASLAKLLWLTSGQPVAPGSRWLSVPEWIVHALGGDQVREPSLASRTGLIRQDTSQPWDDALGVVDARPDLLPDTAPAGTPVGKLSHPHVTAAAAGALLSVAGHDHPVAALAVGAIGAGELFNSSGTADVLARAVPSTLTDAQRAAIVAARWSAGSHVVPDTGLLIAGGSGGLLLGRVLAALGATDPDARTALDAAALQLTSLPPGVSVSGDGRTARDVEIRFGDNASPAAIWSAATSYTADLASRMLADIEPIVGAHDRAVAAGGWIRLPGVRAAKSRAIARLAFCDIRQPGATGAALLAEYSLAAGMQPLAQFLHDASQPSTSDPVEGIR